MLRSRVIACLLVQRGRLVKTVRFANPVYVGDPLNAVRLFNEKQVDELLVLDISASGDRRDPDYELIQKLAAMCRMPFCYGGGINRPEQIERLVALGVEKVAVGAALVRDRHLLATAASVVGSQSVVAVMDVKRSACTDDYEVFINNGLEATGIDPCVFADQCQNEGAGEILVNSIDHDGVMDGYDLELIERVRGVLRIPMTVLGGAGSLRDIKRVFERFYPIGAAAGSLFVFKGRFKAVLINYPSPHDMELLHVRSGSDRVEEQQQCPV